MKRLLCFASLTALCGCFSTPKLPTVSHWLLEYRGTPTLSQTPKFGGVRLSQVSVNMPYAGDRLVVLKEDGTVAFDSCNVFASSPASLLKGVCLRALEDSGLFASVVEASSGALTRTSVEVLVRRLALDCRGADARRAVVALTVRVLDGKSIVTTVEGEGSADAADGNYGESFSKAALLALASAFDKLR